MSLTVHYWMICACTSLHCSGPSPKWPILCRVGVKVYYAIPYLWLWKLLTGVCNSGGLIFGPLSNGKCIHVDIVWPRSAKFGTVTRMRERYVSVGSATPPSEGAGPQHPQHFRTPYTCEKDLHIRLTVWNSKQVLHGNKIRWQEIFTWSTTPYGGPKLCEGNADARSVCSS